MPLDFENALGVSAPANDDLTSAEPAWGAKFKYLDDAWLRFDEDYFDITDGLVSPEVTRMLDTAATYVQFDAHPDVPAFACCFQERFLRNYTSHKGAKVIHVSHAELTDLYSFEQRIKAELKDIKKAIVVLCDTSLWTNKVHWMQSTLLRFLAGVRQTCHGLVAIINFRNWPVDDYFVEPKTQEVVPIPHDPTVAAGVISGPNTALPGQNVVDVSLSVLFKREATCRYSLNTLEFAKQVIDRVVSEPSFNVSMETADWLYQRALLGDVANTRYDCLCLFEHAEALRDCPCPMKASAKKSNAESVNGVLSHVSGHIEMSPVTKKQFVKHCQKFAVWKEHIVKTDLPRLEELFKQRFLEEDSCRDWEPYQLRIAALEAAGNEKMPAADDMDSIWTQLEEEPQSSMKSGMKKSMKKSMKNAENGVNSAPKTLCKDWYKAIVSGTRYAKFNRCLSQTYKFFRVHCPGRVYNEADTARLQKMTVTKGSSMCGDIAQLYRWFEQNGKRMMMPVKARKHSGPKFAEPKFELHCPRESCRVLTQQCMGFLSGNSVTHLMNKEHFGRVWVADPKAVLKVQKGWRVEPVQSVTAIRTPLGADSNGESPGSAALRVMDFEYETPPPAKRQRIDNGTPGACSSTPAPVSGGSRASRAEALRRKLATEALQKEMENFSLGANPVHIVRSPADQSYTRRGSGGPRPMRKNVGITNIHY